MKYGRFLTLMFPILNLMVRNFADEDEGGGDSDPLDDMFGESEEEQASPDDGKDEDSDGGKDASGGENEKDEGSEESSEEQAPAVTDEDLEAALNPTETPEQKAARLERDYSASSKEAQRLNAEQKAIAKSLDEQGLKLVVKDGKAELIPTEKYTTDGKPFEVKVSDMNAHDQEILESGDLAEIQKVIDKVVGDARGKLVRPAPTLDKEPPTISDERKDAVFASLADVKHDAFDVQKHPNIEENRGRIEAFISNTANPQALREAFAAAPEVVAALVNGYINDVKANLIQAKEAAKAASEKKSKEARKKADQGAGDEGTVSPGGDDPFMNQFGPRRFG